MIFHCLLIFLNSSCSFQRSRWVSFTRSLWEFSWTSNWDGWRYFFRDKELGLGSFCACEFSYANFVSNFDEKFREMSFIFNGRTQSWLTNNFIMQKNICHLVLHFGFKLAPLKETLLLRVYLFTEADGTCAW